MKYRDRSIADVLDMTVEEARDLFKAVPTIREKMQTLARVGLDYVHVGQQATTLSGGEAQRVKLSKELSVRATGRTSTSSTSRRPASTSTMWRSFWRCSTNSSTRAIRSS